MNQKLKRNMSRAIFGIIMFSLVILQNVELITQKINIENAIRDKVNVTLMKLLDQSQYVIIVNARMDLKAFSMDDNNQSSNQTKNYYSPIPGLLPTVPQNIKRPSSNTFQYSTDKYLLYGLDLAIYLDEKVANGAIKQNIERLVNDAIPEIADCEDCIRFETMSMSNTSSSSYQDLLDRIELAETERIKAETQLINWKFEQLESQLTLAQKRERSRERSDSTRLTNLQKIELEYRKKQDSLYVLTSINLNEAIKGRIESEADLNDKLIDIIKSGIDSNADSDIIGGGTNPDIDRNTGSSTILMWGAFGTILILLGTLIMLAMKNKQPVYLKPKQPKGGGLPPVTKTPATEQTLQNEDVELGKTSANVNEDVMRSELKSLRQSAVAMSVSQKDGANQIVKDWLESNEEESGTSQDEEDTTEEEKG